MNIGLDIGGTNIKGVLLRSNKVVSKIKVPTQSKSNKKIIIAKVFECIENLLKKGKVNQIGIGVAGPLDLKKQKILNPPNVTGLKNVYLADLIKKKYKIKTVLDNDVNCLILAEAVLGAGKRQRLVVGLGLGTGVGGGIVLDKKIFHGANDTAGEIGHMIIACPELAPSEVEGRSRGGRKCKCGNKGCLETYTNERGIRRTAEEIFGKGIDTISLFNMAKKGNRKAIKVWEITGKYLGIGLANLTNVLNPDILVIGGGIAGAGEFLLKSARQEMRKNILSPLAKNTPVVQAKLGEFAGAIGAGLL